MLIDISIHEESGEANLVEVTKYYRDFYLLNNEYIKSIVFFCASIFKR
jgi:hypothetical protein